ncbi:hypothetical protein [[Kitasatospora] papulosa]|uniref:hypothetical protein n=1 Tax=[Kitasatospora] papulosa TaxID=1464011 RepID=UPI0036A16894
MTSPAQPHLTATPEEDAAEHAVRVLEEVLPLATDSRHAVEGDRTLWTLYLERVDALRDGFSWAWGDVEGNLLDAGVLSTVLVCEQQIIDTALFITLQTAKDVRVLTRLIETSLSKHRGAALHLQRALAEAGLRPSVDVRGETIHLGAFTIQDAIRRYRALGGPEDAVPHVNADDGAWGQKVFAQGLEDVLRNRTGRGLLVHAHRRCDRPEHCHQDGIRLGALDLDSALAVATSLHAPRPAATS